MLDLKAIHDKSIHHKQAVLESPLCGCFYCLRIYAPSEIKEWVARDDERTAICPHCGIDSVLPSIAVDLRPELLKAMQSRWFGPVHVLSAVSVDEANAAKVILQERIGQAPLVRAITIVKDAKGLHMLKVAVSHDTAELWHAIPQTIDGVRVIVDEVGEGPLPRERFFEEVLGG